MTNFGIVYGIWADETTSSVGEIMTSM